MTIKFRAWNVEEKIMHDIAMPSWNGSIEVWANNIAQSEIQYLSNGPEQEGILMQWTGLQDKNGKDIYLGDIVSHHQNKRGDWSSPKIVKWIQGIKKNGFNFASGRRHDGRINLEIIGNIYENLELRK